MKCLHCGHEKEGIVFAIPEEQRGGWDAAEVNLCPACVLSALLAALRLQQFGPSVFEALSKVGT